jgi:Fe-S cluster assembly iron-binding protein IscA
MLEITRLATEKLQAYLADNNIESPVRVAAMSGCGGPSLGLALDEYKEGDFAHEGELFTLLIDKALSQVCGKVTVDFVEQKSGCSCGGGGFSLTSENPLPGAGGGCGSSCSSGSCGS